MAVRGHKRIFFIDELRGFAIICMVLFHSFVTMQMFDSFSSFGSRMFNFFLPLSPFFAALFVLLCGISCHLSRSNTKRGLVLLTAAILLTAATLLIDKYIVSGVQIFFGIIHLLSVCILIYALLRRLIEKIPVVVGVIINLLLFFITYHTEDGFIGINGLFTWQIPDALYEVKFLFPLGFPSSDFYSADYYPLIPWSFMFMCGVYIGRLASKGLFPKFTYRKRFVSLCFVGKYTLWIYILHQPIIYGLLYVIDKIISLF